MTTLKMLISPLIIRKYVVYINYIFMKDILVTIIVTIVINIMN